MFDALLNKFMQHIDKTIQSDEFQEQLDRERIEILQRLRRHPDWEHKTPEQKASITSRFAIRSRK